MSKSAASLNRTRVETTDEADSAASTRLFGNDVIHACPPEDWGRRDRSASMWAAGDLFGFARAVARPGFEIASSIVGEHLHLVLRGELDACEAPKVRKAVLLGGMAGLAVVVDCSDVTFIDAAGIGVLACARNQMGATLINVGGRVLRLLQLLRLDDLIAPTQTSCGEPGHS